MDDLLRPKSSGGHHQEHIQNANASESPQVSPATSQPNMRVRLPKLDEAKRFNGKIEEWQEFWDCYESSIHSNTALSSVDKFSYLRGLLGGAAKIAIAGLALTTANYQVAIDLLKERFGKAIVIERTHVNDLLNVSPVYHDQDTAGLRRLYDTVEVHHRGLKALDVESTTYEGIVAPATIGKLPEGVRLQITRGKNHHEWKMEDLLKELLTELELKEEHCVATRNPYPRDKDKGGRTGIGLNSATALLAKTNDFCAYCKGGHAHQDCMNVKSVEERKHLLRKYATCFICARKGHILRDCKSRISCSVCMGKHHVSICDKGNSTQSDHSGRARNSDRTGDNSGHAFAVQPIGSGGSHAIQGAQAIASPAFHVGSVGRVALQTAQAVVKGDSKSVRVRVLFEAGCHRSFIYILSGPIGGATDKRQGMDRNKHVSSANERLWDESSIRVGRVSSAEFPTIAEIRNQHIEIRKGDYPHLQGLWFSDVNCKNEVLGIDLLIGADDLWSFQRGRTIRGEADQPVALETCLGWVLSGPMKGIPDGSQISVNFGGQVMPRHDKELEEGVRKLWDLETLGIREENEVHEALKDGISFKWREVRSQSPMERIS